MTIEGSVTLCAFPQLHTSLLMTQDTVEQADTRRGKPCWYLASDLVSNAGIALNDASFLETGIYQLLKIHFEDKPYYVDVLELFHDVSGSCLVIVTRRYIHSNK
jgi:farnesyl diphosphate synthase